ncbi:MAG TPA: glycoside hydrolase family 27 protein [Bryobacteraceae bacterium]|nr:glycoside hydrolase family 27 protein [Bryobacteraceae bacterium]
MKPLAATPPMGWNSWDSYGLSVTQNEFEANATYMSDNLRGHGWQYAVVDEGWFLQNPEGKAGTFRYTMDTYGRLTPAVNRFPLAAGDAGFRKLADWAHTRGLFFGIHIIRGIPREAVNKNLPIAGSRYHAAEAANKNDTCKWNSDNYGIATNAAGQAYYGSIAALYASWGVDFVKIDCISSPYLGNEIRMFSEALRKTNRPIVLSLSPGPTPVDKIAELRKYAQMWRISGDVWDHWRLWPGQDWSQGVLGQFALAAKWAPLVEPGHWPDADMLPLGHLGPRPGQGKARESTLTQDEARTLMTLWCMFRSPLVMGGNLTQIDNATRGLLTNDEVIKVDQHSSGSREVLNEAQKIVWVSRADAPRGTAYVALFNVADAPQAIEYPLQSLGLSSVSFAIRDLWERKDLPVADRVRIILRPHAAALFRVSAK